MIYLKFCNNRSESPVQQRVFCVSDYAVASDDEGVRVYFKPGYWEKVGPNDWRNLFVMNESGKTIDKIEA